MSERQRTSTEGDSYQRNKSHSRNISQNNKNDLSYLQGYIGEQSSEEVIVREERNIPYQDTFDNAGTQNNEPLASSRYKHVATIENDSVSTERGRNPMTTRIRHHRNISHNSFPSEDSDKESNDKVLNKHAQSVLQYTHKIIYLI